MFSQRCLFQMRIHRKLWIHAGWRYWNGEHSSCDVYNVLRAGKGLICNWQRCGSFFVGANYSPVRRIGFSSVLIMYSAQFLSLDSVYNLKKDIITVLGFMASSKLASTRPRFTVTLTDCFSWKSRKDYHPFPATSGFTAVWMLIGWYCWACSRYLPMAESIRMCLSVDDETFAREPNAQENIN